PASAPGERGRGGPPRRVDLRPDARQHVHLAQRPQDAPLRGRRRRGGRLLLRPPRGGHLARRDPRRADRQRRHRVRRWQRGTARPGPRAALRDGLRPAAEPPAEPGAGLPGRGDARGRTVSAAVPSDVTADLRSDTLTRPTEAMRQAMAWAPVGDDVYAEDPTVLALQRQVADLLGHEDALFTPTGSMANQLGIRLHVAPGQELISDDLAHVLRAEMGAAAVLSGITSRSWRATNGRLDVEAAMALAVTDGGAYQVGTSLVVAENTHNFGGGTVQPLESMQQLHRRAHERGMAVHLDGARLWNAHVATGTPLADYGACADT